jgi:hypothetical protein
MEEENFQIFSDESGYCGKERFGAIAVVSGSKTNTKKLNTELQSVLDSNHKKEVRFADISGNYELIDAAKDFITLGIDHCRYRKIKI